MPEADFCRALLAQPRRTRAETMQTSGHDRGLPPIAVNMNVGRAARQPGSRFLPFVERASCRSGFILND